MMTTATATLTIFDYANAEATVEALGALAQGHADDAYQYGIERYGQGYVVRVTTRRCCSRTEYSGHGSQPAIS